MVLGEVYDEGCTNHLAPADAYLNESSKEIDTNIFKLFVSTGDETWDEAISYVIVKGLGLPDEGAKITSSTEIFDQPSLLACMPIKGLPLELASDKCDDEMYIQNGVEFSAPELLSKEATSGNLQRYTIEAYSDSDQLLNEFAYWLPLRYEFESD